MGPNRRERTQPDYQQVDAKHVPVDQERLRERVRETNRRRRLCLRIDGWLKWPVIGAVVTTGLTFLINSFAGAKYGINIDPWNPALVEITKREVTLGGPWIYALLGFVGLRAILQQVAARQGELTRQLDPESMDSLEGLIQALTLKDPVVKRVAEEAVSPLLRQLSLNEAQSLSEECRGALRDQFGRFRPSNLRSVLHVWEMVGGKEEVEILRLISDEDDCSPELLAMFDNTRLIIERRLAEAARDNALLRPAQLESDSLLRPAGSSASFDNQLLRPIAPEQPPFQGLNTQDDEGTDGIPIRAGT